MDNLDDILKGEEPQAETPASTEQPQAETPPAETAPEPEAKAERPRGPDGKFVAKGETMAEEPPAAAPPAAEEPASNIPEAALIGERRRRQEAEAELQRMREQMQQFQQPQQAVPDVFEDPEGFYGHIQNTIVQATLNDRLNLSEEMVRQQSGNETVDAAQAWGREQIASNPMFAQQFYGQRNPYGYLVSEYQRHQALAAIGNDPSQIEAFKAWQAEQAAKAAAPAPSIPETLATAQSARGSVAPHQPPSLEDILKG